MILKFANTADRIFPDSPATYRVKKTFFNLLRYLHAQNWMGACHAASAIIFVLLREQGFEVAPCVGEVSRHPIVFDHSWIELDGKIIDAAVSNTLIQGLSFPPVLLGIDLLSGRDTELDYGYAGGRGLDDIAATISSMSIGEYMSGFPGHPSGLWGMAANLAKAQSLKFNVKSAERKWGDSRWQVKV